MKRVNLPTILGIDIAKAKFDACLQRAADSSVQRTFANTPEGFEALLQWLRTQSAEAVPVGIEATGSYWVALAHFLYEHHLTLYLLNPAYVKAHGQSQGTRSKTDRVDARLIAHYLSTHECEAWEPLPAEREELRELMRLYADVTTLAVSASQRREGLRTAAAQQLLSQLTQSLEEFAQKVLHRAREQAQAHPSLKRPLEHLDSIPGIGTLTALVLVAELPRGRSARTVAAWAGLTPRQHESGSSVHRRPKLCKQGSDYVRQAYYWPAISALRCSPGMQAFGARLQGTGLNKMQIIGAAMHKLLRWSVGVLNSDKPFDPRLHATA